MNEQLLRLFELAKEARKLSHCPYSKKSVGAAVLCGSGKIYRGANIENSSFGATVCAERVALYSALMGGEREFYAIAIAGGDAGQEPVLPFPPCGICRQVLSEFFGGDGEVYILGKGDEYCKYTLRELLPEAFSLKEKK